MSQVVRENHFEEPIDNMAYDDKRGLLESQIIEGQPVKRFDQIKTEIEEQKRQKPAKEEKLEKIQKLLDKQFE
jgi:hypothetical protein